MASPYTAAAQVARSSSSPLTLWRGYLTRSRMAATGFALVLLMGVVAVLAPWIAPYDPMEMRVLERLQGPSLAHPLGTDNYGRDLLSRILYGARLSLEVGFAVVLFTTLVGVPIGLLAGYYPRLDNLFMGSMDALMAFPAILLAIAIMAALGPHKLNVVLALGVVYTPRCARIVRASVLALKRLDFVDAARALGASDLRIMFRHILPGCLSPLAVQATFIFAYAILAEASLSFIGAGPPPPTPSWGNILSEGRVYMREAPWITIFPGLAIAISVLGLNLAGDGLRDLLDPRLRGENYGNHQ